MLKRKNFWYHEGCPTEGAPLHSIDSSRRDGVLACRNCGKMFALCNYMIRMSKLRKMQNGNWDFLIHAYPERFPKEFQYQQR